MLIKSYTKKPITVDAFELTHENLETIWTWLGDSYLSHQQCAESGDLSLLVGTLEGAMTANKGDFIIKGVEGEFYPCKRSIFNKTYCLTGERNG